MSENESAFEITKRRGIIVWVYSLRQLKSLKRFGLVHY
ncbi:YlbG family protein, partial [Enterococcus cecorum]|nr:YlbG family protein [Enterococcus cecorum]